MIYPPPPGIPEPPDVLPEQGQLPPTQSPSSAIAPYGLPQQPPPPYAYYGTPYGAAQPRTATAAIVSLVFGLAGFLLLPAVAGVVAIVVGSIALRDIGKANGMLTGRGLAIGGIIAGAVQIVAVGAAILLLFGLASITGLFN